MTGPAKSMRESRVLDSIDRPLHLETVSVLNPVREEEHEPHREYSKAPFHTRNLPASVSVKAQYCEIALRIRIQQVGDVRTLNFHAMVYREPQERPSRNKHPKRVSNGLSRP